MAILIFTIVNGLGVVFLLYVLVQFWKEGHRSKNRGTRQYGIEFSEENRPEVVVIRRPISGGLQVQPAPVSGGLQVQPAPVSGGLQVEPAPVSGGLQVADAPLARQSSAASGKPTLWRRRVESAPVSRGLQVPIRPPGGEPAPDSADRTDETSMKRFSTR
jgi:hypothetical protein